jgi:GNAT superfamily N-acetyltransferase
MRLNKILKPSECNASELEQFKRMVLKGGQVNENGLASRIFDAVLLAFHFDGDKLVGIAAIKNPRNSYKVGVFKKAGYLELESQFQMELGWVFTLKECRGQKIASNLIEELINYSNSKNLFATTKTNNTSMHYLLIKNGFEIFGKSFSGRDTNYPLHLYLRKAEIQPSLPI